MLINTDKKHITTVLSDYRVNNLAIKLLLDDSGEPNAALISF